MYRLDHIDNLKTLLPDIPPSELIQDKVEALLHTASKTPNKPHTFIAIHSAFTRFFNTLRKNNLITWDVDIKIIKYKPKVITTPPQDKLNISISKQNVTCHIQTNDGTEIYNIDLCHSHWKHDFKLYIASLPRISINQNLDVEMINTLSPIKLKQYQAQSQQNIHVRES